VWHYEFRSIYYPPSVKLKALFYFANHLYEYLEWPIWDCMIWDCIGNSNTNTHHTHLFKCTAVLVFMQIMVFPKTKKFSATLPALLVKKNLKITDHTTAHRPGLSIYQEFAFHKVQRSPLIAKRKTLHSKPANIKSKNFATAGTSIGTGRLCVYLKLFMTIVPPRLSLV